jgi:hypothetical protein
MNNLKKTSFEKNGYEIIKIFSKKDIQNFKKKICKSLNNKKILKVKLKENNLGIYHKFVNNEDDHKKIVKATERSILLTKKLQKKIKENQYIKNITKKNWNKDKYQIKLFINKKIKNNHAVFRLARPDTLSKADVGGYHIDLHYDNKINKNINSLFTIWTPIVGFNNKYTLKLSPMSHKKKHPLNQFEKQNIYISKVFKKNYTKKFKFIRPNLKIGESIIFHPNLLHGGSLNFGKKTRISIDFRIYNK